MCFLEMGVGSHNHWQWRFCPPSIACPTLKREWYWIWFANQIFHAKITAIFCTFCRFRLPLFVLKYLLYTFPGSSIFSPPWLYIPLCTTLCHLMHFAILQKPLIGIYWNCIRELNWIIYLFTSLQSWAFLMWSNLSSSYQNLTHIPSVPQKRLPSLKHNVSGP